jgi:hypothetical protein
MLIVMREAMTRGILGEAVSHAKDLAPYVKPRLAVTALTQRDAFAGHRQLVDLSQRILGDGMAQQELMLTPCRRFPPRGGSVGSWKL